LPRPIFFLVAEDVPKLQALAQDLKRRYEADYRILEAASASTALTMLGDLANGEAEVALLIADERLHEMPAVDFLARAHALHPGAKRVLLIHRGDWSSSHPVVAARALGKIDYHLWAPWHPDRFLYSAVGECLAAWDKSREPPFAVVRIVGGAHSPQAHWLREVSSRAGLPYQFLEDDSEAGRQLLRDVGMENAPLPVVVYYDGKVLAGPSEADLIAGLGFPTSFDAGACDVLIVGAGPAGLAAAVYAASEGLTTVVLERVMFGGQAGTSPLIRNYPGFPHGLAGADLAVRVIEQAWLFGANMVLTEATKLTARGPDRVVRVADGSEITARAVVIATGVTWRRLGIGGLEALVGAGVYYGAVATEARAVEGQDVFVIGAGNSAGQTAIHLSKYAASVTMVVRGPSLRGSMSEYLVTEIGKTGNIVVSLSTEIIDGSGRDCLETLTLRHRQNGSTEVVAASALFVMVGAEPHTQWLEDSVARDDEGFILTGQECSESHRWQLERPPRLLETSMPAVFAAGDVRRGSVKRVASAIGEGAIASQLLHEYLQTLLRRQGTRAEYLVEDLLEGVFGLCGHGCGSPGDEPVGSDQDGAGGCDAELWPGSRGEGAGVRDLVGAQR